MWFVSSHNLQKLPDEALLSRYRNSGDIDVLGILYNRHIHLVYAVALKYLRSKEDAADAVMDVFEKLIDDAAKFEIGNFRGWLHKLTRNHCLMVLRSRKSKDQKSRQIFMEIEEVAHQEYDCTVDENLEKLKICLEELNGMQRQCVEMFFLEQKSYKQVASRLEVDFKEVKSHIQNGKRNLKNCIERLSEEQR